MLAEVAAFELVAFKGFVSSGSSRFSDTAGGNGGKPFAKQ